MSKLERRDFLKAAGVSAAALPASAALGAEGVPGSGTVQAAESAVTDSTAYPKLSIITPYSPEKLRFAAAAGYEGVVVPIDDFFDPDKLSDTQIDQILSTAREAGVRIVSIECMWGLNHIAKDPAERRKAQERFVRCLEFGHRLGCKFVGTFSGTLEGAKGEDQAKALAEVVNEKYMPVCDKLDLQIGWENYPCNVNFAVVPALWNAVFALVPNPRLGLEFDPSAPPGTCGHASTPCTPKTPKSPSPCSSKSAFTATAGGATAFPARG
jgi:Xylose isomerase-like TIM barrel